jgi:hypothetical protein
MLTEDRRKNSNPAHGAIVLKALVRECKAAGVETLRVIDIENALKGK